MKVQEDLAKEKYKYRGVTYYFCAKGCYEKFKKDPEKYIAELQENEK